MEFWYVEVWCMCSSGEFRIETFAPFSSEEKAFAKRDECLESPFLPHDPNNYIVGNDKGEILPDGRIICGQHVFKPEALDTGINSIECKWFV
jgi:hypothetical protein